ncbi:unnamed protein product [Eruca vesicaria subsp. sativa]|uniref:Mitochondrial import inner membrane translocase subunit TIM50 n=1 Tax=Eruca vesicaria subsp. sativa TaxID=29727 RepID=A0ABC8K483_ERUVS|nr:unnamed protein product [Eruca vesicaria subsp. sativa]
MEDDGSASSSSSRDLDVQSPYDRLVALDTNSVDSNETLVHSTLEPCDEVDFTFPVHYNEEEHVVYVRCRPYLKEFMERVSFEIIIFTASQSIYAKQLLNVLDPKRKLFECTVTRVFSLMRSISRLLHSLISLIKRKKVMMKST